MRALRLLSVLALAACGGPQPVPEPEPADALLDLWAAVPAGQAELRGQDVPAVCDGPFGTWFDTFGVRGLACSASQIVPLGRAAQRAPGRIWTSGPHGLDGAELRLDLRSARAFGHYDPAFVAWAVDNAIPTSDAARRATQGIYDRSVRRLARVYWLGYASLAADGFPESLPAGPARDYAAFLEGRAEPEGSGFDGGVSVFLLFDERSQPISDRIVRDLSPPGVVGASLNPWEVRYEANTALGFWIRRRADGSEAAFRVGLKRLLRTYDAAWLASNGG